MHCNRNKVNANCIDIVKAAFYCAVDERYGIYEDEIAIIGSDNIANKIAAIILAKYGISSTVFHTPVYRDDMSGFSLLKYSTYDDLLHTLFDNLLKITVTKGVPSQVALSIIIDDIRDIGINVFEARNAYPVFNTIKNRNKYYWIDYCNDDQLMTGNLIFWKRREAGDISLDVGNPPLYRAKFRHIFYTSSAPEIVKLKAGTDYTLLAGANSCLENYERYGLRDRAYELRELTEKIEQYSLSRGQNA